MGVYLNPGCQRFKMSLDSEIFVDKSPMILQLNAVVNTNQRFVCVSRPRRFGKSIVVHAAQKYYTIIQELDTGKGYADIVYLPAPQYPDKPALLIELKYEKDVVTAADQIRDKKYFQKLEHYKGNLLLVSINYDKTVSSTEKGYKHHSCMIENITMQ